MVGYYSFVIPKNSDAILYGEIFINWIDSLNRIVNITNNDTDKSMSINWE